MRDDEGNWRPVKPGPNWITPVDTGAMKVGDKVVSPSTPELDGGKIVAVSKVRRPINLIPVAEVEPLRAELGLDPQEFSLVLGYSRGAYAEMLRDGRARPVVLLAAEALARRHREAEPDDELRRVLAAVRRIEAASDYRLVRTKHNGEEKLVWRAEVT
jgi:hypothetical protein